METRGLTPASDSAPLPVYDALVVGAGPAGSACAAKLAEVGWKVVLVDRAVPGRERVCGGFLGPEFERWMRAWGWSDELKRLRRQPVREVQISGEGSRLVRTGLTESGYAVDRGHFDRWTADLAVRKGAELWTESTAESLGRTELWTARIQPLSGAPAVTIRARHWVNATGRRPASAAAVSPFFACKATYEGVRELEDAVALHFVERGHVGLNWMGEGRATLCLCVDGRYLREAQGNLDVMMRRFVESNTSLRSALESAHRVTDWKTCQAEPDHRPIFYENGKFFVGDALSMVNPVIGGGIPIAMQSGTLLADLLVEGQTEQDVARRFERAWRRAFVKKFRFGNWIGRAERSRLAARLVVGALNAAPRLLAPLVRASRPAPASGWTPAR